jgi:predicted amidohydrolase
MMSHPAILRIGLASARNTPDFDERLQIVRRMIADAGKQQCGIVCFPECYLPGLRGQGFPVPPPDQQRQETALREISSLARQHHVAVIMGMEWESPQGLLNIAMVIENDGTIAGFQAKNQIAPEEDPFYVAEGSRRMFHIEGIPFGIAICHEGWRYPESVRWSARRGARIVFHPHITGSDTSGPTLGTWGDPAAPYYEQAMRLRSLENAIYFASVNSAFRYQESATSLIGPEGNCLAFVPYGEEALLVCDVDLSLASGIYAERFNPDVYPG